MASTDEEVVHIISNKENSVVHPQPAIEAQDLASLLFRFEEATSADDLNIPSRVQRIKKDVLAKAKSAGSSPAVTPPATPPPQSRNLIMKRGVPTASRQPFLLQGTKGLPIQVKFVVPSSSGHQVMHSYSNVHLKPPTVQAQSLQASNYKSSHNQDGRVTHSLTPGSINKTVRPTASQHLSVGTMSVCAPSNSRIKQTSLLRPVAPKVVQSFIITPESVSVTGHTPVDVQLKSSSAVQLSASGANYVTVGQKMSSSPLVVIPPPQTSAIVTKSTSLPLNPNSIQSSNVSLLQSFLQTQTSISSQLTSTQLSKSMDTHRITQDSKRTDPSIVQKPLINRLSHQPSAGGSSHQSLSGLTKVGSFSGKGSLDHDYCFLKLSTKDILQSSPSIQKRNNLVKCTNIHTRDEDEEDQEESNHHAVPNLEETEVTLESSTIEKTEENEFVFEEGEFFVDADGNDVSQPSNFFLETHESEQWDNQAVPYGTDEPSSSRSRRQFRKYRRRAEFSSSPVREDKDNFFDKIPSHYTALSIPTKVTKISVFASAKNTVGSTDHLDIDTNEPVEEGHYDKVPAHRRCFTNTTKDVEIVQDEDNAQHAREASPSSLAHTHGSSSRHSHHSSASHFSHRSSSRQSVSRNSYSRSPDRAASTSSDRRSRSMSRHSRSLSRNSDRSSSSCSTCSSCSYCSTCSGSSWSRSRSGSQRSRSSRNNSVDSDYSRSRSRSPAHQRDRQQRAKRLHHNFSRLSSDRGRSRSRSADYGAHTRLRYRSYRRRNMSPSEHYATQRGKVREQERLQAMEERRVLYVGKIPNGYTKRQLHRRFQSFGEIKEVKLNFREHGDNYGFVTFAYACDAYAAKEKGNTVTDELKFDLCFGGRRQFCPDQYADLDGNREIEEEYAPMPTRINEEIDYAALLKQHSVGQRKK